MNRSPFALLLACAAATTFAGTESAVAQTASPTPSSTLQPKPQIPAMFGMCSGSARFSVTYKYKGAPVQVTNNVTLPLTPLVTPPPDLCPTDVFDIVLPSNGKAESVVLAIGPSLALKKQEKCETYSDQFNIRGTEGPDKGRVIAAGMRHGTWGSSGCVISPDTTTTVKRPANGGATYRITVDANDKGKPGFPVAITVSSQGN